MPTNRELLQAEWHALINDPEELLPVIRNAVESGTIKGAFVGQVAVDDNEGMDGILLPYDYEHTGDWLCIPVSDGGEDRP